MNKLRKVLTTLMAFYLALPISFALQNISVGVSVREVTPTETTLGEFGKGLGYFMQSITAPFFDLLLGIGLVVGIGLILLAVAKTLTARFGRQENL